MVGLLCGRLVAGNRGKADLLYENFLFTRAGKSASLAPSVAGDWRRQANLMDGMMNLLQTRILAVALASTLVVAGCGKRQSDAPTAATADVQQPAPVLEPSLAAAATDDATTKPATPAGEFMAKSMASPFATSDMGLKESYDRALIAFQIGDYARAASELQDLAENSHLTTPQKEAVQNLLMQTLKVAPNLAATNTVSAAKPIGQIPGR
jgi:hypothetical protein